MTVIANIATRILAENNYTTTDCTAANCEYLIKKAVDYVNGETGGSVSFSPSGTGTESLTASDAQLAAIQNLSTLLLRAFVDRGPNVSIGGITVSSLTTDPQYTSEMMFIEKEIKRLIGVSFTRV